MRKLSGKMFIFCVLIKVWVIQIYSFVKISECLPMSFTFIETQNMYLRCVYFIIYILCKKTVNKY